MNAVISCVNGGGESFQNLHRKRANLGACVPENEAQLLFEKFWIAAHAYQLLCTHFDTVLIAGTKLSRIAGFRAEFMAIPICV